MPVRTVLAVQDVPAPPGNGYLASFTWTAADAANGMSFPNDGNITLLIKCTDGSSKTTTVLSVADAYGRTGDLAVVTPPTTGFSAVHHLVPSLFNQSDGSVYLNFSAATGLSVAVIRD